MSSESQLIFQTRRLHVRTATEVDVDLFYDLWTDPRVMTNVGFPSGLSISREEVAAAIQRTNELSVFERRLVVALQETAQAIGECSAHRPDGRGVATTDVKLRPEYWGHHYGVEVKKGLLDFLFTHTDCRAVQATPNVANVASIKMQEAVGGVCVAEGVFYPALARQAYASPVHHYLYVVYRADWDRRGR
jgi:[ribosomal protein S5]-alanine N-acetyltransferase